MDRLSTTGPSAWTEPNATALLDGDNRGNVGHPIVLRAKRVFLVWGLNCTVMPSRYKTVSLHRWEDDAQTEKSSMEKGNKLLKYRVVERDGKFVIEVRKKTRKEGRREGLTR